MYADDMAISVESQDELQTMLNYLHCYTEEWSLPVNVSKTKTRSL